MFLADSRLLDKVEGRLVTISLRAETQNTAQPSKEPMERDAPSLPFLYQG
jgi:hypothetical protein